MPAARSEHLRPVISVHGLADYPPGATFGPRDLRDYEFVWIVEGDVVWQVDGAEFPAPAGTVLLARPGMRDGFRWDPLKRTRHGFFHFTVDLEGAGLPPPERWPMTIALPDGDILRPLFHHLDWLRSAHPPGWEELQASAIRHALVAYVHGAVSTVSDAHEGVHPLIHKVMSHVCEVWSDGRLHPLSLEGLARAAGVSRAHLARLFREHLGATPVEAMRLMRLDRAAGLLARTNLEVQEIAEQCGFVNAFHFSRVFHKEYGSSPRAFRKKLAEGMHMPAISLVRVRDLSAQVWRRARHNGG
jgi:AraC-like DNA-binding protein